VAEAGDVKPNKFMRSMKNLVMVINHVDFGPPQANVTLRTPGPDQDHREPTAAGAAGAESIVVLR
jgi:hypothetical protein